MGCLVKSLMQRLLHFYARKSVFYCIFMRIKVWLSPVLGFKYVQL